MHRRARSYTYRFRSTCSNTEYAFIGYFLTLILVLKVNIFGTGVLFFFCNRKLRIHCTIDVNLHFTLLFSLTILESSIM